jgi:SAM-dependent methyltransferase
MGSRPRDPKRIVEAGYDEIALVYRDWAKRIDGDPRFRLAAELASRLPDGARVVDIGCGNGIPSTAFLASRFEVTGVDISAAQLALARVSLPDVRFVHGDVATVELPPSSFDAATAFYSLTHVPRAELARLFERVATWLVPGGYLLASLGSEGGRAWVGEWLGAEMFFDGWDAETNRRLLRDAGFELVHDEVVSMQEPEGAVAFLWVLARKTS